MKNLQPLIYSFGMSLLPVVALAHGEVDDGHVEEVAAPNPEMRGAVIVVLVVFALGFAGFIWNAKKKNAPTSSASSTPPSTPTSPSPTDTPQA